MNAVTKPDEGKYEFGTVDVLDMHNIDKSTFRFNEVSVMAGKASFEYVAKVIELAKTKMIDATITGPIHKEAIQKAGFHFAGHTEIYAALTNTKDYTMMLADGGFRVVHVSTHVSLLDAIKRVKKDRVLKVIQLANDALKKIDIKKPRIAVAGLNPHAGENGLFGREEIDEIMPAIEEAKGRYSCRRAFSSRYHLSEDERWSIRYRGLYVPRPGTYSNEAFGVQLQSRKKYLGRTIRCQHYPGLTDHQGIR